MTETAKLRAANATQGDGFGQSAAINGNVVVVGAPGASVGANQGQGAAYIFQKPPTGWINMSRANELTASDGVNNDNFGISVALRNKTIVVGSIGTILPAQLTYSARKDFVRRGRARVLRLVSAPKCNSLCS